jgi:hypothetical protein
MKGSKIGFLEKYATDPRVASAVEVALVQTRIEQHVAPEVAKARDTTPKAMRESERDWQRAIDMIVERATQTKVPGGARRGALTRARI